MASIIYLICLILFLLVAMLFATIYFLCTEMPSLKTIYLTLGRDLRAAYLYFQTLFFIKKCHQFDETLIDKFRSTVKKNKHRTCFIFQEEIWTYQMVDELSNKIANYFASCGYSKGDEVALLLDNCPEYACFWLGLAKIGVVTALINTNLKRDSLGHSINCLDVKAIIFGRNFSETIKDAKSFFNNRESMEFFCFTEKGTSSDEVVSFPAKSLNTLLEEASTSPIDPQKYKIGFNDKMIYIYTSGTTGLPKAAIIRHKRFLWIGVAARFTSQLTGSEVVYNPLPMYHTAGGLLFVSMVLVFGGSMIIRKKFSASNYWKEAAKYKATVGQYIGEICRYLLNQPFRDEERQHCIKLMFGNGLRPHIWKEFQERFRIKHIIELYGATEGNANIVNMFGKQGAVGFLTRIFGKLYPVSLVKVDPETREILRNEKGFCIRCKPGEPGEMIGKIISNPVNSFDGYANQNETKKKIIRDCFEKGDMAFLSGDILVMDEEGYLYFVDRAGDSFRWRGENVSSGEVENIVSTALGHASCVVYGVEVPNVEGKAGMAAIQADPKSVDFSELYQNMNKRLPSYAIPLFLRISKQMEETVNVFGKQGAVGFLLRVCDRLYPVSLIKVDPETREIVRNEKGFCIRCKPGEQGEMIGKIISNPINSFDGYADRVETKKKIIRNCFEKGDMAFLSGDILKMDEEGYLYFVDRAGDTFRWRGENVSTGEVENIVSTALGRVSCVVYGVEVPNVEGKAGMAFIQTDLKNVNFSEFYQNISKRLPSYATPLFLRFSDQMEETGTYKLKKVTYQKEGFNPGEISDPLFFLDAKQKTYSPLTKEMYSDIITGKIRL